MATNRINILEFPIMKGTVPLYRTHTQTIVRPNVNGQSYRFLGQRSLPFTVETIEDEINLASARITMRNYGDEVARGAVQFVKNDHDYLASDGLLVKVIAVEPRLVTGVTNVVGGNYSNSEILIVARWTLQFVDA